MATPTFNAGIDYFEFESATSNKVKVTSSNENRSKQSTSGANLYGDPAVVDSWGETAAPSADYLVVDTLTQAAFELGTVHSVAGMTGPVVLGGITIITANGQPPTISASGQMVQTGATQLRSYTLPSFTISPRHRAQDFCGLVTISKGSSAADPDEDYGLENVTANFPIEFTLAQPKGVVVNYDLHGGMATVAYSLNWYASTAPTNALSAAALAANATMSEPVAKADPEGGYTQYTFTVSIPMIGSEYVGA